MSMKRSQENTLTWKPCNNSFKASSPLPSSCPPHPWSCKQHRLSDPCPHLHKHLEQPARGREVKNSQVCELQKHMKCSTSTVLKFLRVANQLRLFIHLYVEQKTLWSTKNVFFGQTIAKKWPAINLSPEIPCSNLIPYLSNTMPTVPLQPY